MRKYLFWLLICFWFPGFNQVLLWSQDEYPVVVGIPKTSVTVFTNYQLIELTYTVGYLDGYQPLFEQSLKMSPKTKLEIDSSRGSQPARHHKRKYKNENYEDLTYYLRYIGEKKEDISIPEQIFHYVKTPSGQTVKGQDIYDVKAPGVALRYDSVLTKEADDIMDVVDFGSFKELESNWKMAAVFLNLLVGAAILLLFCRPAVIGRMALPLKVKKGAKVAVGQTGAEERLAPKEALEFFLKRMKTIFVVYADYRDETSASGRARVQLAKELRRLITAYALNILDSDTPKEIHAKVIKMEGAARVKNALVPLAAQLVYLDLALYGQATLRNVSRDAKILLDLGNDLKLSGSFWRRTAVRLKNILGRFR